jgi:glycosyltransferase involved in cell wall biosynthesis
MPYRILFLTPDVPYPLHQGTALRNFGLVKGLAERGHRVSLITFGSRPTPTPLDVLCENVTMVPPPQRSTVARVATLLRGQADLTTRLESDLMRRALREQALTPDIVHIEGLEMAPYLPLIAELTPHATLIYDAHNAEHALQARIAEQGSGLRGFYSRIQARRLRAYEAAVCQDVDAVFACSPNDADLLQSLAPSTPITVVPNAIETKNYISEGEHADLPHPAVVFTGKMDFRPNVDAALWFAEAILPHITHVIPDVIFAVVGQKPHPRLEGLRTRADVRITGWVEAIQPYIRAADVYVAPLRMGSGTRFKLLETMATGRAIVSTSIGAEGLHVTHDEHLMLADDPQAFAAAVVSLLQSNKKRDALITRARELVTSTYDWSVIIPFVEEAYRALRG